MFAWLKKQAEILTSLSIIAGAISAMIVLSGGHIPPWYSRAQASEDKQDAAIVQKLTVDTLTKLNARIDAVTRRQDSQDCSSLSDQLATANSALANNPANAVALALRVSTMAQARAIPNCMP